MLLLVWTAFVPWPMYIHVGVRTSLPAPLHMLDLEAWSILCCL